MLLPYKTSLMLNPIFEDDLLIKLDIQLCMMADCFNIHDINPF